MQKVWTGLSNAEESQTNAAVRHEWQDMHALQPAREEPSSWQGGSDKTQGMGQCRESRLANSGITWVVWSRKEVGG